jgi:hypothetical protein
MDATQTIDTEQLHLTLARTTPAVAPPKPRRKVRAFWMKQLHTWHWMSAAVSLLGTLLFAVTGLTPNHAASIGATPKVTQYAATLAPPLLAELNRAETPKAVLPRAVADAVNVAVGLDTSGRAGEWSAQDVYVAMPGPGRDAWVSIDRKTGVITSERTSLGWVSCLKDLHKGRNTGAAWFWFIDVFAVACIVFTLTGLVLLQLHSHHRRSTWPIVGAGIAIPVVLAIFFIHSGLTCEKALSSLSVSSPRPPLRAPSR